MQTVFVWIGLGLVFLILTMIAFAHAVTHVFPSRGERVFWIVVALLPFLGWVLYFGVGVWRSKKAS